MFLIGSIITIVLYPIVIVTKIKELIISLNFGYKALYYGDNATQSGYTSILMYLFFPGLICMLIGSNFSKKTTRLVYMLFGIYAVIGLLSGDRGSWLYSLVILIWLLMQHKGIKWKTILKYGNYENNNAKVDPIKVITLKKIDGDNGSNIVARNVTGKYVYENRKVFEYEVRL